MKVAVIEKFRETKIWLRHEVLPVFKAPFYFIENIWLFRKQLWRFRVWDYSYNLKIFMRSFELTAEALESKYAFSERAKKDAKDIRKFIQLLEIYHDPFCEAERLTGKKFNSLFCEAFGENFLIESDKTDGSLKNKTKEEQELAKKEYENFSEIVQNVEKRAWKNAWKLISRRGQCWWD